MHFAQRYLQINGLFIHEDIHMKLNKKTKGTYVFPGLLNLFEKMMEQP